MTALPGGADSSIRVGRPIAWRRTSRLSGPGLADARALTSAPATFDRTLSLLVFPFIPDMDRAILEMCRVTRPGGIVGGCVWDAEAAGQGLVHVFWDAAVALDPSAEARHVRNRDTSRRGALSGKFGAHGLVDVEETFLTVAMVFTGFDDFGLPTLEPAGPTGPTLRDS